MFLSTLLRNVFFLILPISVAFTTYLYLYPVFHQCAFPAPDLDPRSAYLNTLRSHVSAPPINASTIAPFRLLALGDPQLEGDSSIPDQSFPNFFKFWDDALLLHGISYTLLERIRQSLHDLVDFYFDDIPRYFEGYRKRLDLFGNDFYLAHIYRTVHWWTNPTHVSVLGDLIGSQWVNDEEFARRSGRYWDRVFKSGHRISDNLTALREEEDNSTIVLGDDAEGWSTRVINIAGNHDIGYAGDITVERLERFENAFGKANYELRFIYPLSSGAANNSQDTNITTTLSNSSDLPTPELRIVVLNDMNLDTPALSSALQGATYSFLNHIITTSRPVFQPGHFTLLLTHIPLFKETGVCTDGPFFSFFDEDDYYNGGVQEQNHLSASASNGILEGIFGMSGNPTVPAYGLGRAGLILTGHDHEGCDVYHYINQSNPEDEREWQATRWENATLETNLTAMDNMPGIREITLRSMMGDFGGYAGLLSLWFDTEIWEWRAEFATCSLGPPWIWWAVHVFDFVTLVLGIAAGVGVLVSVNLGMDVKIGFSGGRLRFIVDRSHPRRSRRQKKKEIYSSRGREQVGAKQQKKGEGHGNGNGVPTLPPSPPHAPEWPLSANAKRSLRKKKSRKALALNGNMNLEDNHPSSPSVPSL